MTQHLLSAQVDTLPLAKGGQGRAVVIGAGLGGLASAMRLGAKGWQVTVVDRLDRPGGRGSSITQGGHRFDLGPTIVTVPQTLRELWTTCGRDFDRDVRLVPMDPYYKILWEDGSSFTARNNDAAMEAEVARLAPDDLEGFRRFLKDAEARYWFGFEDLGRRSMHKLWDLVKVLPKFAWYRADRSVYAHAARRVRDPRLRFALSFHPLFIGGDPFHVTSMYALVSHLERAFGVHYAMGGVQAIAEAMAGVVRDQGGFVLQGVEADEVLVSQGRASGVRLADGRVFPAEVVVSNADPATTYTRLLRKQSVKRWTAPRLMRSRWSMSLFVWYFGTKRTRGMWPEVGHHSIVVGPRYREHIRDIFQTGHLADDMSLYVHRPSVTDPSVAPEGDDTFYVLSPVPHLGHKNGVDWATEAEPYRQKMLKVLEERLLPGLTGRVSESLVFTPETFRDRYLSPHGAGFSLEPRILQSAWFRPHNVSEELPGLYLAGAGTHPGAGVPGVIGTAEVLASLVPEAPVRGGGPVADGGGMIADEDMAACRAMIRTGSLSFHAASRLLPARVRDPALALYAFCRVADDDVDEVQDKAHAVLRLRERLDLIYAGRPEARPSDRAFAAVVEGFDMPRALPDALLEGLAWDAMGRQYRTLSDLHAYSARVASAVGVMMCVLMRVRDPDALARAADLGLAMQLTNIARDVGEDARAGRLFLPLDWLEEAGIDAASFLADPQPSEPLARVVRRLLSVADDLYHRAGAGVFSLPADCRLGIAAARHIYAAIGGEVAKAGHDSVTRRARTSRGQKLVLMGQAMGSAALTHVMPRPAQLHARPVAEVAFLVEAAGQRPARSQRSEALLSILAQLEARDRRGAV